MKRFDNLAAAEAAACKLSRQGNIASVNVVQRHGKFILEVTERPVGLFIGNPFTRNGRRLQNA